MPLLLHWHTEPLLLGLLVGLAWAYGLCVGPLAGQLGGRGFSTRQLGGDDASAGQLGGRGFSTRQLDSGDASAGQLGGRGFSTRQLDADEASAGQLDADEASAGQLGGGDASAGQLGGDDTSASRQLDSDDASAGQLGGGSFSGERDGSGRNLSLAGQLGGDDTSASRQLDSDDASAGQLGGGSFSGERDGSGRNLSLAGQFDADDASAGQLGGGNFSAGKAICFYAGLAAAYLAVGSPLDQIGEHFLFSAHMVQHLLLIYVVPVLLLAGLPAWLKDAMVQNRFCFRAMRFLTRPLFAGFMFTALYNGWHHPILYEAALHNKSIHALEHFCMVIPALLVWWGLQSDAKRLPAMNYGARMLYVFVLMLGQVPLFGFLTFASEVLYPTYGFAPRIVELTALEDQILGGILMKVGGMLATISVMAWSFKLWYAAENELEGAVL